MRKKKEDKQSFTDSVKVKKGTIQGIVAIVFFVASIFTILASFGHAGFVGEYVYKIFKKLFGVGYTLLPLLLIMLGVSFLKSLEKNFDLSKMFGSILFFISGLGIIDAVMVDKGGIVGELISLPLLKLFDFYLSVIILVATLIISILITFEAELRLEHLFFWRKLFPKRKDADREISVKINSQNEDEEEDSVPAIISSETVKPIKTLSEDNEKPINKDKKIIKLREAIPGNGSDEEKGFSIPKTTLTNKQFIPPPLSLLERDKGKPEVGDIKANANIIKRTLQNFGINVEMDEVSIGPSVTRYALKPAEGVKLSRIIGLNNDLALALAAHPIRIEAPIPGKSLVGIEIPNTIKTTVGLASLLGTDEFQKTEKPLLISLGKGISGKAYFANLAKAPHMLIAGATGSGKSVTIHTVITSLLFRNSPDNLKFIMIDPKRVELTLYNKIPHLLTPVITDAKKAILALKWAAKEMDRRYDVLEKNSVRDIESYHKNILKPVLDGDVADPSGDVPEPMPYIVVVIDELADIMQTYPRELESAIVRLAQMSRAVGIHLILSTQRPSVNVITGLIKANVPTRIALQVASQIDSRTILDTVGAEKLLGAGDMLYLGGEMSKPQRLQSAYISENELKKVVKYLSDTYKDEIINEINLTGTEAGKDAIFESSFTDEGMEDDDALYEDAKKIVIEAGKASTSYIQRKLRVGYARAARLVDMLEERGVIGPADGAKPREVIDTGESMPSSNENLDNEILDTEEIDDSQKNDEDNIR
jgi:S-DNA-T family DNA segregation ATPase FtsK/SpoIIIE